MRSIESRWGRNPVWTRLGRGSPIQSCQMFFQNRRIGGQNPGCSLVPRPEPLEPGSYCLEWFFLLQSWFGLVWSREKGILGSFWLKFWQGFCICSPKVWLGANSQVLSGPLTSESRWSCPCWCILRSILVLAWPWRLVVAWGLPHSHIFERILLGFHHALGPCLWGAKWWFPWFLLGIKVGSCWRSWPPWPGWECFPNISLVPQRCPGHSPLTHRGWHKILWCNEKGPSSWKLSLHQPLIPSRVSFFFPIRWKSKKVLEHVSPYLNHLAAERWLLRLTKACKTSTSFLYNSDKMSSTCLLVGSCWSYSSTSWIFFACTLTCTPLRRRLSFANLAL